MFDLGPFCGKRIDQIHEKQTVRILDKEHGPRMATRPLPLFTGEHHLLVSSESHASRPGRGRRIPGRCPRTRCRRRGRFQVQSVGVRSQILRDRSPEQGLHHQPDGVGRQFFLPTVLVSVSRKIIPRYSGIERQNTIFPSSSSPPPPPPPFVCYSM